MLWNLILIALTGGVASADCGRKVRVCINHHVSCGCPATPACQSGKDVPVAGARPRWPEFLVDMLLFEGELYDPSSPPAAMKDCGKKTAAKQKKKEPEQPIIPDGWGDAYPVYGAQDRTKGPEPGDLITVAPGADEAVAADAGIAPLPEYEGASKGTAKKSALGKPRPAKTAPAVEFDSATSPPPAMPPPAAPPPRAQETRVTPPPPGPATESSDVEFGGDGKDAAAPGWRQSTTTTVTGPGPAK